MNDRRGRKPRIDSVICSLIESSNYLHQEDNVANTLFDQKVGSRGQVGLLVSDRPIKVVKEHPHRVHQLLRED